MVEEQPRASVGQFSIVREIGRGATTRVYEGIDPSTKKAVAVRVCSPDAGPVIRVRLMRGARLLSRVQHPAVIAVQQIGEHDGGMFVVTDLARGEDLSAWLRRSRRGWREIIEVFATVGRGLAAVHAQSIVLRDFSPRSVIVGDDGQVHIVDFGVARTVAPDPTWDVTGPREAVVGHVSYSAPEALLGASVDARSDQFSFCVALFEALYGVPPFEGSLTERTEAVMGGQVRQPPDPRDVPKWVHEAVVVGLSADPQRRWPTMTALLDALARPLKTRMVAAAIAVLVASIAAWLVMR